VWDVSCLEMGYWISDEYARQGFMTEAVNALTQYAIKQLGMKKITITCDISNIRSRKIPERLGFNLETTLKGSRVNPVSRKLSDTLAFVKLK
jgi:ribosomal-protein-serine acetyltransferase